MQCVLAYAHGGEPALGHTRDPRWQDAGLLCMLSSPMAMIKYSHQKQLRGGEGLLQLTANYLSLNRSRDRN